MKWEYGLLFNGPEHFLKFLDKIKIFPKKTRYDIHHTHLPNHTTWSRNPDHRRVQDGMRNFHVNTKGWADIAQHITIFPDGKIMTGRNINLTPVSASNYNIPSAFMIEMVGDFDKGKDILEGKQLDSVVKISAYFEKQGAKMFFHREGLINGREPKTCPGTGINKQWLHNLVLNEINKGGKYIMEKNDAEKIIRFLSAGWFAVQGNSEAEKEFNRLANEIRKCANMEVK